MRPRSGPCPLSTPPLSLPTRPSPNPTPLARPPLTHPLRPPPKPQERERREAETEANRGVYFRGHFRAAPTSAAAAAARGIRRAADKLVLPASVGALLMAQEAFKNGVGQARGGCRAWEGGGRGAAAPALGAGLCRSACAAAARRAQAAQRGRVLHY
jgi:hypothetical protein